MGWIALRAVAAATFAVSLVVSGPVTAQDLSPLDKGLSAYNSGSYAGALEHFRISAAQGDARAQFALGVMYDNGEGVPENDAEAVKWYRLAAAQGLADAQYNLGNMYSNGEGVPENDAEAVKWYRLAAAQGNASAQLNLGVMYDNGDGVPENDAEAVKWYSLAAAQGHAGAQNDLGLMYFNGEGVPENHAEAVKWFRLAAAHGNARAQTSLGTMYANGRGVPESDAEAVKWFRLAAAQGIAEAQFNLALMYGKGEGVPEDFVQAYMWFNLAAAQGNLPAREGLEIVRKLMTPAQIAEAQGTAEAQVAPLSLDLVCGGQYAATETSTADVGPIGTINSASITTNVMRPGSARVTLRGDIGELIYPDGRQRILSNVIADTANIKAEYVRRTLNYLFIPVTWRLEIDRMTGNIRIGSSAGELGFLGVCEAAPTVAKF